MMYSIAKYAHFHADKTECCAFNPFSIFVGRSTRAGVRSTEMLFGIQVLMTQISYGNHPEHHMAAAD